MPMPFKVINLNITKQDIKEGKSKDCDRCAAALALKRRFPGWEIEVYGYTTNIGVYRYTSDDLAAFVKLFDDMPGAVKPGIYKLKFHRRIK